MRVSNGTVDVDLSAGAWSARWPDSGMSAGPFTARVDLAGRSSRSGSVAGEWTVQRGEAAGRPGTWARWVPVSGGPAAAVHVPDTGPFLVAQASYRTEVEEQLARLIPLEGAIDVGDPAERVTRLVNGYQSWDYAGVRPASTSGRGYWGGGYCRTRDGAGLAFHALSARRFCTTILSEADGPHLHLVAQCGGTPWLERVPDSFGYLTVPDSPLSLPMPAGSEQVSEPVAVGALPDALAALEAVAQLVAAESGTRLWQGEPITGWESWYYYGREITPDALLLNARILRERFGDHSGFRLLQLDDGWQRAHGIWRPAEGWPLYLQELTNELRDLGCVAGLWLAPFMVVPEAGMEQSWLIADPASGEPRGDGLMGRWAVDATHPKALDWLRQLGEQVRAWGFRMVKLDFLYLGAMEGRRHDPTVPGTEALRRGLAAVVEGLGEDVYVLGCGMPMLPAAGLCHGNRIGGDLDAPLLGDLSKPAQPWETFLGIRAQARNAAARFFTHGHLFANDPDVVMACGPDSGPPYSVEEARTLATLAAMCGGPYLMADELVALSDSKRAVLEHEPLLRLVWDGGFRPLDLFDHPDETPEGSRQFYSQPADLASCWVAERDGQRAIALFNWTDRPARRTVPFEIPAVREIWTGTELAGGEGVSVEVPPHAVRLLVVP